MIQLATRRERVILELEDKFTADMIRAAAAAKLLDRNLNSLSGSAVSSNRGMDSATKSTAAFGRQADTSSKQIDKLSGRIKLIAQAASVLGPALVPLGAPLVGVMAGLTAQMGAVAGAVGVTVLAFNGMGDGLKALNAYQLEPTAENFAKMQIELERLGPAGADFVRYLDEVGGQLKVLQMTAREGLFPGMEDGIESLLTRLPQVQRIIGDLSEAMGGLARDAGADLAGPEWSSFFRYLDQEAGPILTEFGQTVGNFAQGFAGLLVGLGPLTSDFSGGLQEMSESFADWSAGLASNTSFQEFLSYVRDSGPAAVALLGELAQTFAAIIRAAAPVGDAVLPVLTNMLEIIGKLADSPLGPLFFAAAAAMSLYSRGAALAAAATTRLGVSAATSGAQVTASSAMYRRAATGAGLLANNFGKVAAGAGLLALAYTDVDEKAGLSNTATLGLAGAMAGPLGAAAGAAVGLTLDLAAANDDLAAAMEDVRNLSPSATLDEQTVKYEKLKAQIEDTKAAQDGFGNFFPAEGQTWSDKIKSDLEVINNAFTGTSSAAQNQLAFLGESMKGTGGISEILAGQVGMTGRELKLASGDAEALARSLARVNEALTGRSSMRDYEQSLDDLSAKLKEIGNTGRLINKDGSFRLDLPAAREAQAALDQIAVSALGVAEGLKGASRVNFLRGARADFIGAAQDIGLTREQAAKLATELGLLSGIKPKVKVKADTDDADRKLKGTGRNVDNLDGKRANPKVDAETAKADRDITSTQQLMRLLDGTDAKPSVTVQGSGAAQAAIQNLKNSLAALDGDTATTFITTVRRGGAQPTTVATGGFIRGAGTTTSDSIPAWLSDKEYVVKAAAVQRYGVDFMHQINAQKFASGGLATRSGGSNGNASQIADIAALVAEIRDLKRELARDGKDELTKLQTKVANLDLKRAEKQLEMIKAVRSTASGFSLDGILPQGEEKSMAQQTTAYLRDFRRELEKAGGTWTSQLGKMAKSLTSTVGAMDREIARRDRLTERLGRQQQALDSLISTMASYSQSVAGNFLSDPFNKGTPASTSSAGGGGSSTPAPLSSPALQAAEAQLAGIRASVTGDSISAAAAASRLLLQIRELKAGLEDAVRVSQESAGSRGGAVGGGEADKAVTGLQALRNTLLTDTKAAKDMLSALSTLATKGLDTDGPFGALYKQLAASGDSATAQELAELSRAQIDEYEKLFAARENAAAAVAAQATQAVYGREQAVLIGAIRRTEAAISRSDRTIDRLNARLQNIEGNVRDGAARGVATMEPELRAIRAEVRALPPEIGEVIRRTQRAR